jgi:ribonuclease HI
MKKKTTSGKAKKTYIIDHAAFAAGYHVFCDGCCEPNPGPGGWGVVAYRDGLEIASIHGGDADTTNNRMELTGLLRGIECAKALKAPVTLWCDSQYAVKGTNEWRHSWKKNGWLRASDKADPKNRVLLNSELWQAIDAAITGPEAVRIKWCKGHAGIMGNERADALSSLGLPVAEEPQETGDYLTEQYRLAMM